MPYNEFSSREVAYAFNKVVTNDGTVVVRPPQGTSADLVNYMDGHFRRVQKQLKIKTGRKPYTNDHVVRILHTLVGESEKLISLRGHRLRKVKTSYDTLQRTAALLGIGTEFDNYE